MNLHLQCLAYGTSWPFLLDSAPKVSGSGGLSTYQTVTVNGLAQNTTYYYVLMSTDQSGNVTQTVGKPFMTTNSTTPSAVITASSTTISTTTSM